MFTQNDVETIMGRTLTSISVFKTTALQLMVGVGLYDDDESTALIYASGLTEKIYLWLTAHFAASASPDKVSEEILDAKVTYAPVGGSNLAGGNQVFELQTTRYGRAALLLDVQHYLRRSERKPVSFAAMGPIHADWES